MDLNVIVYGVGKWLLGIAALVVSMSILLYLED